MKAIVILLALIGLSYSAAEAQEKKKLVTTKTCNCRATSKLVTDSSGNLVHKHPVRKAKAKTTTSTSGDNYQVCREEGGHYTCCKHKTTTTTAVTK